MTCEIFKEVDKKRCFEHNYSFIYDTSIFDNEFYTKKYKFSYYKIFDTGHEFYSIQKTYPPSYIHPDEIKK